MTAFRVLEAASRRIDDIYRHTARTWGLEQADRYIDGLFDAFAGIDGPGVLSRPVPAAFGVVGFYFRYRSHYVYWRRLSDGAVGVVTILHERMHQMDRFREGAGQ